MLCDRHGILLIVDEVQTGFGRTGRMFGIEHSGVKPDMITIAKSLAGGFPLSAVIGRAAVIDAAEPGGLGGTYSGSPIACAAALAVLDVIEEEKLIERANVIGAAMKARLEAIARRNDTVPISAIRGPGAMVGFDIVEDPRQRRAGPRDHKQVQAKAREPGWSCSPAACSPTPSACWCRSPSPTPCWRMGLRSWKALWPRRSSIKEVAAF